MQMLGAMQTAPLAGLGKPPKSSTSAPSPPSRALRKNPIAAFIAALLNWLRRLPRPPFRGRDRSIRANVAAASQRLAEAETRYQLLSAEVERAHQARERSELAQ